MSIAKILAPVFGTKGDAVCLATAFAVARPFNAHVQVLFAHPDPREAIAVMGMPISGNVVQAVVESQEKVAAVATRHARIALAGEAENAHAKIVAEPACADCVTASYREATGRLAQVLEGALRYCDLAVFPPRNETDPEMHDVLVGVLSRAQRPVLLAPAEAPARIGTNIAVGWDGSMTAAHALTAALPYLRNAQTVTLISVRRRPETDGGEEAKNYLALHRIAASICAVEPSTHSIAETLLETVSERGCDLLAIGGYGHSHLRETLFGGVTQYVMSHAALPVFLAH
ncbi:MAG TPA: universal stress protein [Rhizomicrobium sp.]|nr:universal stress protein [Rhizomicrobium sp.]